MNETMTRERLVEDFIKLTSIDSESLNEREMADVLKKELEDLGFQVYEDNCGEIIKGNAGNIYGILKGDPNKEPMLFSAHMDTVKPGIGKVPLLVSDEKGEKFVSEGDTVLGSDDISGIVEILEGIRLAKKAREDGEGSFGDIEILFSVCEEVYGCGASEFDYSKVRSKIAYALDLSGHTGIAATKAPSIISFEARILGKAAHSGFEPEKGINALQAAAKAIASIEQGHIPGEMTLNVGTIRSGKANNIVAEECVVTGEVRGFNHQLTLEKVSEVGKTFEEEAVKIGAGCEFEYTVNIKAFDIDKEEEVCTRFLRACKELGLPGTLVSTHGGSDNAFFVEKGIKGIVPSCGMSDVHSVNEYCYVEDLIKGAYLVRQLLLG